MAIAKIRTPQKKTPTPDIQAQLPDLVAQCVERAFIAIAGVIEDACGNILSKINPSQPPWRIWASVEAVLDERGRECVWV